ncbi:hypothetical protein [Longimicrobium sp.]|uniref:hypothetical protein n=1 Tax=Longimicrobium sp. TaxID=2029185 RepID=UPI002E3238CE|nr:hypothetical protein [Longimicrobium sp.]HEX6041508.1 hypothetical protein [Longimicrobium sp.]
MPFIRRAAVLASSLLLSLTACRGDADAEASSLVGRWEGTDDDVEFFDGGRVLLRRGQFRGVGRYEWVEPGRVLVTYEGALAGSVPGDYRVNAGREMLELCETDRPARCIRYARHAGGPTADTAGAVPRRDASGRVEERPRLAQLPAEHQSPPEARAKEGEVVLKQAYTLQSVYKVERGAYARDFRALEEVGWQTPPLRHFHPPRVVRWDNRLCIVIEPRAADLWPLSVDENGTLGRGKSCG